MTNGNAIPNYQVQPQPIGSDKSVVSQVEVVNDTVTDGDTVPIVQVQSQPVASTFPKVAKI